jgi:hypothetical protein
MEDNKSSDPSKTIPRHVLWRRQYRNYRYLQYLSKEELLQRAKDVLANQLTLTDERKIGFYDFVLDGDYLLKVWTHVLEEFVLRGYVPPAPFEKSSIDDIQVPKYEWPGLDKAIENFRAIVTDKSVLIKFGKDEHLRVMIEVGSLRVSSAASYADPSLNPAIRDSELELSLLSLPSEVHLEVFDGKTGHSKGTLTPTGNVKWTMKARTNYYAYCLASRFDPRMFGDFEADAFVVIKDPVRFVEAIQAKWDQRIPEWDGVAMPVTYVDPFARYKSEPDVYFSKHFRYSYQKEFRCIWLPPLLKRCYNQSSSSWGASKTTAN